MHIKDFVSSAKEELLDLVYPGRLYCICCGDSIDESREHGLCDVCISKINWLSENPYALHMDEFAFDEMMSCCVYGFYARKIMNGFKLSGKAYYASYLGKLMAERIINSSELAMAGGLIEYDFVTAVPMTKEKMKRRGFNQSALLAREVADSLDIPFLPNSIEKIKETSSMRASSAIERGLALEGCFSPGNIPEGILKSGHIILVDDVMTTGGTANACSVVLKNMGIKKITLCCFASGAGVSADEEEA